jgi:RNA polymerase sigma-70 factor (ECF subfamily)
MNSSQRTEQFVQLLTDSQDRLFAYILSLLPNPERARDVLQETNLVLWRKSEDFVPGSVFMAWACKTAYFQVLAYRRDRMRDKHVFSEELLRDLAERSSAVLESYDRRQSALGGCMEKLSPQQQHLVRTRYVDRCTVAQIAEKAAVSAPSIVMALHRIRQKLMDCIERSLGGEATP